MKFQQLKRKLALALAVTVLAAGCTEPAKTTPPPDKLTPSVLQDVVSQVGRIGVSNGDVGPVLVVFDEKHTSRISQLQIAVMLTRLYDHGLRHMLLEGAVAEAQAPDAAWFLKLPDEKARRAVALQLLRDGEINAAEFAAMVLKDFKLHPSEHKVEYDVEISDKSNAAPTYYLMAIAQKSMSSEQIVKANKLITDKKPKEAIEFTVGTDPWTKQRYDLLMRTEPVVTVKEMLVLLNELESKAAVVGASVAAYQQDLQGARTFFKTAQARSQTMSDAAVRLIHERAGDPSPLAISIGAAHTDEYLDLLDARKVSFAAVSPLALSNDQTFGDLSPQAYDRKLEQRSVDAAGSLGAYLDGRRKPQPVLNSHWLNAKARLMYAGSIIARAAAAGGGGFKPPFNLTRASLGLGGPGEPPGPIDIDLNAMQVSTYDHNGRMAVEVAFPVILTQERKTIWLKVGQVPSTDEPKGDETLEQALHRTLAEMEKEPPHTTDQIAAIESGSNHGTVNLAIDVLAKTGDSPKAVEGFLQQG